MTSLAFDARCANALRADFIPRVQSETSFFVFSNSADRIAAAAAVAASGAFVGALNFFSPDGAFDDLESLAGGIATQAGIDSRALPCYAIVGPQLSSLFIYPGAFATADSAQLTAWCNAALGRHPAVGSSATGTIADPNLLAPPHRKSEPRPPHDCDVNISSSEDNSGLEARQRKGPMRVVADSFDELVVQSNTSVLLELANDWSAPCKQQAPLIGELHRVLSAVAPSSVAVARLNVDHNWIDPAYFPLSEKSLPNIKFFARGNKSTPTRFGGERSVAGLVRFVHRCMASQSDIGTNLVAAPSLSPSSTDSSLLPPSASSSSAAAALFDLDAAIALASRADRTLALAARCRTTARTARRDMALHPKLLETDRLSVEAIVGAMQALEELEASAAATEADFVGHDTRLERLEAAWAEWDGSSSVRALKQEIKNLSDLAERTALRQCESLRSEAEIAKWLEAHNGSTFLCVIAFTAEWCTPCQQFKPTLGLLSDEYAARGCRFGRVDVDAVSAAARAHRITAMPTFVLLRRAEAGLDIVECERVAGADANSLRAAIERHLTGVT